MGREKDDVFLLFNLTHIASSSHQNKYTTNESILPLAGDKMQIVKVLAILTLATTSNAGPVAYGICQAGCAAVVTACYAAGGATWGATAGATASPTIIGCNTAFGSCQAACYAAATFPCP
ncbi:hypothetical protein A0O28_0027880 [Trichoderma guizhouense]|uniref:Uncharacterized protein n=1 Tax=Trichoderma guizhouense TaxID=1491466 RepID=A0A1T3CTR2_9HYPO|nr:hypothetical protein A0O28_0027880 [Trichoderma guizhouense]